jgi:segregation and condensation protein B
MNTKDIRSKLEALLFVGDEPASTDQLASMIEADRAEVADVLGKLQEEYARDQRGFQLHEVAGGWRLYSNPAHHELISEYILSWDTRKLSQAALETLAVVAYRQPVTRGGINAVRGVSSEGVLGSLVEKGLVCEVGRDKTSGNAILYATTKVFLEKFGLKSTESLPPLEEFAPERRVQDAIRSRLDTSLSLNTQEIGETEVDEDYDEIEMVN